MEGLANMLYCWWEISERNYEFCEKTGKSASEILALSKMVYGEHAMKKSGIFE